MDTRLQHRLRLVARRLSWVRLGWSLAGLWLIAAAVGWLLAAAGQSGFQLVGEGFTHRELFAGWLGLSLLGAAIIAWQIRQREPDWKEVARRVEGHFPNLEQRLVTAAEITPNATTGAARYLQRTVISEALRHDVHYGWRSVVSPLRLTVAWVANLPALLCMLTVAGWLWQAPPAMDAEAAAATAIAQNASATPIIEPGDTEIERGASLIVTAKFERSKPDEVWLVHATSKVDGSPSLPSRIKMRPSLNDPIFAAYLFDIKEPLQYRVEYDSASSAVYRVAVFEYPGLVRADAELTYPTYAQQEPRTILDTRRVTAGVGTTLTWKLQLNKPVATAELRSEGTEPLPLVASAQAADVVTATIELTESRDWTLHLLDNEGRAGAVEVTLRAKVLPNERPKLQLLAGGDVRVSALEEFQVSAKVSDDFAVVAAGIGYQFAGGELVEIVSQAAQPTSKQVTLTERIDMETLRAAPDQLLSYYAWSEDLDEQGVRRRIVSDMFFAEVRPFEEIFRQGEQPTNDQQQQQQQQPGDKQTEELLELQKQIIVATWNVMREAKTEKLLGRSAPDLVMLAESQQTAAELLQEKAAEQQVPGADAIVKRAASSMQAAIDQLMETSTSLAKNDLTQALAHEQTAYQELLRLQSREHEVVRSQRSQSGSQSQRSQARQQQIDQLELEDNENRYENERQAQEQQNQEQSELRQVISRLRELAARQEDLNKQLREVQAALQAAEKQEQREELQRQLERLREQQQQILADSDELAQRLESQTSETMQDAQQQMQQARENIQQSSEALRQGDTGQALAAGTRAEQELKQLQDEVRQQAANQFQDSMQEMKQQASQLEERQQELLEQMSGSGDETTAGLRGDDSEQKSIEQIKQQQAELSELLDDMQQMVTQAEEAEPLLAQKLYDSFRRAQQEKTLERMQVTEQLVQRNLSAQARELATASAQDLTKLRTEIDDAAEAVLGSEVESLRLALSQLDSLSEQLDNEIATATGRPSADQSGPDSADRGEPTESTSSDSDDAQDAQQTEQRPQQPGQQQPGQQQPGQQQPGQQQPGQQQTGQQQPGQQQPGQQQPGQQQPGQQQPGQQQPGQQQPGQQQPGQQQPGQQQPGQQQPGQQQPGQQQPGQQQSGQQPGQPQPGLRSGQRGGSPAAGPTTSERQPGLGGAEQRGDPISGEGFRDWSDRLRDVEELVLDPELRWQATEIRQTAREIRSEMKKHSAEPRWAEVEDLIATPLRELKRKVADELVRRAADKTEIVPLDRDPVPSEFERGVREYFEKLGSGR